MLIALVAAISVIAVLAFYFPRGLDAMKLVADLAHVQLPLTKGRSTVERKDMSYLVDGRQHTADLYVPQHRVRAGLVLVPGAAENGRNDARLVDFATSMTRSGFAVLVPDIDSLRRLEPKPEAAQDIRDAVMYLRDQEELIPNGRLGICAFSIAVGPAMIAALEPSIRDHVQFLLLIGGYHDLRRTLTYLTTGWFEVDGRQQHRAPNQYGKWVYALSNASRLHDPSARTALSELARAKLKNTQAPVDDLRARLDKDGEAIYELIANTDPSKVPRLMDRLPAAVQADIAALDLAAYDLSPLKARVILIHGRDDDVIPYTESISLASALPRGQAKLYVLEGLHHVNRDFHAMDLWRTWQAMRMLLTQQHD